MKKLQDELDDLKINKRKEVSIELKEARAQG
ncbi:MAG: transcription elongation factor GreA, partial [Lachnospiraceae bacterium]|nr:transcription elongation factor GreA [Lachnospiraceae bacterium]